MSTAAPPTAAPHHHPHAPSPTSLSISASLIALSRLAPHLAPSSPTSTQQPLLDSFFGTVFPNVGPTLSLAFIQTTALAGALKPLASSAKPGDVTRQGIEAVVAVLSALQAQKQGSSGGEAQLEGEAEVAQWLEGFVEVVEREVHGGQQVQDSVDGCVSVVVFSVPLTRCAVVQRER